MSILQNETAPHQLADFYDSFYTGDGDDKDYIDGLIIQTNKGNIATLYARSQGRSYGLNSRKLSQVVGEWSREPDNPFHYSIKPLPPSIMERWAKKPGNQADSLLTIMGFDLKALTREVKYAKVVLAALGLRKVGPKDPDTETQYHITTKKILSFTRKESTENSVETNLGASHLPLTVKSTAKMLSSTESGQQTTHEFASDDWLAVGAAREWLFLKAIAAAADVPGQPSDCLNLYRQSHDDKKPDVINPANWAVFEHSNAAANKVDKVNGLLNDAGKIRAFLVDNLQQMEARFTWMSSEQNGTWATHLPPPPGQTKQENDQFMFRDIANAVSSITVQAQNSLSGGENDDFFGQLTQLSKCCESLGGFDWAVKDFKTLAHTAELLNIVERHAMFFQQETVNRIQNGKSELPSGMLSGMRGSSIEIRHGYGQRVEGRLVKPGQLPAGFPGEFPCVKTGEGFAMIPGAQIEKNPETGQTILVTPAIPDVPRWLMSEEALANKPMPLQNMAPDDLEIEDDLTPSLPNEAAAQAEDVDQQTVNLRNDE